MKKILISAISLAVLASCGQKTANTTGTNDSASSSTPNTTVIDNPATAGNPAPAATGNEPVITFEQSVVEIKPITEGESVEVVFKFKNTGGSPLVLSAVEASCGCTVPNDWPKDPIAPGAEGKIRATYNSEGKGTGTISKSITVVSNATVPRAEAKFVVQVSPKG